MDLFVAIERGDAKTVDRVLTELTEADYNPTDYKGRSALHVAVEHGHHDVVEVLIGHEDIIKLDAKDPAGFALHLAAELGRDKIVARLLEERPEQIKGHNQVTCLHLAAARGHATIVRQLLELGNDEDKMELVFAGENRGNLSALNLAHAYGHPEVVTMLVETVKSNIDDAKKMFRDALWAGSDQVAMRLLTQNPELANTVYSDGYSALHLAAFTGCHAIAYQLLAQRPRLAEVGGTYKMSLLHFAAEYGYDTLVAELLVEKPHLIDVITPYGETVLHLAAANGHKKVVALLLACEARASNSNGLAWSNSFTRCISVGT